MKGMSPKRPEAEGLAAAVGVGAPSGWVEASGSGVLMGEVDMVSKMDVWRRCRMKDLPKAGSQCRQQA
jgi:hypothetical protein